MAATEESTQALRQKDGMKEWKNTATTDSPDASAVGDADNDDGQSRLLWSESVLLQTRQKCRECVSRHPFTLQGMVLLPAGMRDALHLNTHTHTQVHAHTHTHSAAVLRVTDERNATDRQYSSKTRHTHR